MILSNEEKRQLRIVLLTCEYELIYNWIEKRIEKERKENFNTALSTAKAVAEVELENTVKIIIRDVLMFYQSVDILTEKAKGGIEACNKILSDFNEIIK